MEKNIKNGEVVVSTGMSIFDEENDADFISVFARADKKMYERKRQLKKKGSK